jgi:chromatin structure-remodeling complex subunit RSC4
MKACDWVISISIQDYFHKIMASIPPEFLGVQTAGKIKLKLPGSAPKHEALSASDAAGNSLGLTLKLPAANRLTTQPSTENSEANPTSVHPAQPRQTTSSPPAGKPILTAQPTVPAATSVGSRGMFPVKSASPAPSVLTAPQMATKQPTPQPHSYTPSPAPPELPSKHPIQSLVLQTTPHGRIFYLDRDEGVRFWAVRLGAGERGIRVNQLQFVEESNVSDGDDEEEDEESEEEEPSIYKGRRKGSTKEMLVPKDKSANSKKEKGQKEMDNKKFVTPDPTVRLNGTLLRPGSSSQPMKSSETKSLKQWQAELLVGSNNLEIRAGDVGEIWKIFLDRQD